MTERSKSVFGNKLPDKTYRKAVKTQEKNARKFGRDDDKNFPVMLEKNAYIGDSLGVINLGLGEDAPEAMMDGSLPFDTEKGIIVGNIRMGFGHYRISMAMASCAKALGYTPYWMDLNSYPHTTATKVISAQNDLYSLGSRLSQKSKLFNHFVWEPINYTGFKKLTYNAPDQKNAELMGPLFKNVPKDIPLIATHVWPAQAALHGDMKYVVNAIPDNWPMALHFAEGSLHTIQCHYAYQGYRTLNGMMGNNVLKPMPEDSLKYVGHYVDDELVRNIETDCEARMRRKDEGKATRFLLTIGGAGAQKDIFAAIIAYLIPFIREGKAVLYVNVGDYKNVWDDLKQNIPDDIIREHMNDWNDTEKFAEEALTGDVEGLHAFWHDNIFEAVYATNLLMRSCDVLVTKPSELSFYPVPKLFIKRVGGHEQWGAIHSAEMGDGTLECRDIPHTLQMIELFMNEKTELVDMCQNIITNKAMGVYDGGYEAVKLAFAMKNGGEK